MCNSMLQIYVKAVTLQSKTKPKNYINKLLGWFTKNICNHCAIAKNTQEHFPCHGRTLHSFCENVLYIEKSDRAPNWISRVSKDRH